MHPRADGSFPTPRFGLREKVATAMGTLALVMVVATVISFVMHNRFVDGLRQALDREAHVGFLASEISQTALRCRQRDAEFRAGSGSPSERELRLNDWKSAHARLEAALDGLSRLELSTEDSAALAGWRSASSDYKRGILDVLSRDETEAWKSAEDRFGAFGRAVANAERVVEETEPFGHSRIEAATQTSAKLTQLIRDVQWLVVLRGVGPVLIVILLVYLFTRIILRRLSALSATMKSFAAGNLAARFADETRDEIGIMARQFNEMAETIQTNQERLSEATRAALVANHSKSEFLANMSHEIRTPMTAILGFADELSRTVTQPEGAEAASTIKRNGEHLLHVINDILDLSKIEAGKLEIERQPISPRDLLRDVKRLMRVRADDKGLPLVFEYDGLIPEFISTDPTRVRQILINLIGNAVKFTERGSVRVVTRLKGHGTADPQLEFEVIDTGVGISPGQVARLFQAFSQADSSTTREFGGTGLGLVICRRLTEMLGGRIGVVSEPGLGSCFTATIATGPLEGVPLIEAEGHSSSEIPTAAPPKAIGLTTHVLVVEDGPDNQLLIRHMLERAGARVTVAENGRVGVELTLRAIAKGEPFGVILMDMQMPELDGYEATRQLRSHGCRIPIIALTAHAMNYDRQRCLEAGCDDYLSKPIDRQRLLATVASCSREGTASSALAPST